MEGFYLLFLVTLYLDCLVACQQCASKYSTRLFQQTSNMHSTNCRLTIRCISSGLQIREESSWRIRHVTTDRPLHFSTRHTPPMSFSNPDQVVLVPKPKHFILRNGSCVYNIRLPQDCVLSIGYRLSTVFSCFSFYLDSSNTYQQLLRDKCLLIVCW